MQGTSGGIARDVRETGYFVLMADEVTDASNEEQLAVGFRHVDEKFEAHEHFVGLNEVDFVKADTMVACEKNVMLCMNLSAKNR